MSIRSVLGRIAVVVIGLCATASISDAKTFVFPHVIDTNGAVLLSSLTETNLVPNGVILTKGKGKKSDAALDTTFVMSYMGGLPGAVSGGGTLGATVALYLYDQVTGQPMLSGTGVAICNPCTFALGTGGQGDTAPRKRSFNIDTQIRAQGGFPSPVVQGFVVATVSNDDANTHVTSFVTNAKSSALDLAVFAAPPQELQATP